MDYLYNYSQLLKRYKKYNRELQANKPQLQLVKDLHENNT